MSSHNYRAYFFNNMYLTGIHAGIQAQHCTAEMFVRYERLDSGYIPEEHELEEIASDNEKADVLWVWGYNDKTTVILNGGYASNLMLIEDLFDSEDNLYPWAVFRESMDALGGCITSVGIILPEKIYNYNSNRLQYLTDNPNEYVWPQSLSGDENTHKKMGLTDYELKLAECVSSYRLMS